MEHLKYVIGVSRSTRQRAHVGVVSSGDLEILLEPTGAGQAVVTVRTSVDGFSSTWEAVITRFFTRQGVDARVDINDFGATPGVVWLRLAQVVEASS